MFLYPYSYELYEKNAIFYCLLKSATWRILAPFAKADKTLRDQKVVCNFVCTYFVVRLF